MTKLYFKVEKTSPVMAVIEEVKAKIDAHWKGRRAFMKECGFPTDQPSFGTEDYIIGVAGRIDKPGWRYDARKGCSVPARNTPEGKEIEKRRKAIPPGINWMGVSETVFEHGWVSGREGQGSVTRWAGFCWSEKGVVITMHADVKKAAKKWPKGLKEITGSQADKLKPKKGEDE